MRSGRPNLSHVLFVGLLVLAVPTAYFHYSSGRYAQGMIAIGAASAGVWLARRWLRGGEDERGPTAQTAQVVAVPPLPIEGGRPGAARLAEASTPRTPQAGWLLLAPLAGLAACGAMTLALEGVHALALAFGGPGADPARNWWWTLVHNPFLDSIGKMPGLGAALFLALGLGWAVLYAGLVEPHLGGSAWTRGARFGIGLWALSLLVFFPLVGGGLLGLAAGAGPLPLLCSLGAHLVYGVALGALYARPKGAPAWQGLPRSGAAFRSDIGAALGLAAGVLFGAGVGTALERLAGVGGVLPTGGVVLGAALVGGALGMLLGSLVGLGGALRPALPSEPIVSDSTERQQ